MDISDFLREIRGDSYVEKISKSAEFKKATEPTDLGRSPLDEIAATRIDEFAMDLASHLLGDGDIEFAINKLLLCEEVEFPWKRALPLTRAFVSEHVGELEDHQLERLQTKCVALAIYIMSDGVITSQLLEVME